MSNKIVIIGLGTGGLYSSRAASRFDRDAMITIIEKRDYDMFSPCGLPYAIEGKVKSFDALKHNIPTTKKIKKYINHEATSIDTQNKIVDVKNIQTNEMINIPYDSLILSTGSRPVVLPIPGAHELLGKGVFTCSTPEEAQKLTEKAKKSKNAVIVGGGAIGLEIAFALKKLGLTIYITKRSPPPLPRNLDPDMGKILEKYLKDSNIHTLFGKTIERINGVDKVESVVIQGEEIKTDIVVMAVGISPNTRLAEESGVKTERGYILVDKRMETNIKDIYALGDCTQSYSAIDGKPARVALATTAFMQGPIAGINAAGGNREYEGSLGTFVSYIGDLEVSCTGYNSATAENNGIKVVTGRANMQIKPSWMPDTKDISIKLVADSETGVMIGGQAIGEEGAASRMNIVALAIKQKMTIQELYNIELAYCPAVSELFDPLLVAAENLLRKYNRKR